MPGCRHRCCGIRDNAYHAHVEEADGCRRCREVDQERFGFEVDHLVDSVIRTLAPEIPGLPVGAALDHLVRESAAEVCRDALDDPLISGLDARRRRTVLAGRVAVAIAFPPVAPAV